MLASMLLEAAAPNHGWRGSRDSTPSTRTSPTRRVICFVVLRTLTLSVENAPEPVHDSAAAPVRPPRKPADWSRLSNNGPYKGAGRAGTRCIEAELPVLASHRAPLPSVHLSRL
jgi:hypothetical protein